MRREAIQQRENTFTRNRMVSLLSRLTGTFVAGHAPDIVDRRIKGKISHGGEKPSSVYVSSYDDEAIGCNLVVDFLAVFGDDDCRCETAKRRGAFPKADQRR